MNVHTKRRARVSLALLIVLLMLPNIVLIMLQPIARPWVSSLLVPVILLGLLFAVFGNKKTWIACLLLSPFAALAPLEIFYVATYQRHSDAGVLATLGATTLRETYEYLGRLSLPLLLCCVAGFTVSLFAAKWTRCAQTSWTNRSRGWTLVCAASIVLVAAAASTLIPARLHARQHLLNSANDAIEAGFPFGVLERAAKYYAEWKQLKLDTQQLASFQFHAKRISTVRQRQIYVLVIGESSTRDRWQLFGYSRPTNPELSKTANLVPITNMLTSWPITIMAVPTIVTRKPPAETGLSWNEASIIRAMQETGFDTWWISNQFPTGKYDSPVATYALEANHAAFLNHGSIDTAGSYDQVLWKPLQDAMTTSRGDLFIILHMMGSHLYYDMRYPQTFKIFRPTFDDNDAKVLPRVSFGNSYDNTIVYTDHVLAQIIGILRKSESVSALYYVSDHGETLPTSTCSKYGHGNGVRGDFKVPAIFWYSDAYAKTFPERIAAIRANANQPSLSADTFESLVDMAGIDFPGHDVGRSLFSSKWRYQPRIVNPIWQVDYDKAVFSKSCDIVLPPGANANN